MEKRRRLDGRGCGVENERNVGMLVLLVYMDLHVQNQGEPRCLRGVLVVWDMKRWDEVGVVIQLK